MKALAPLLRSVVRNGLARRSEPCLATKSLSTSVATNNSFEPADELDEFTRKIFDVPEGGSSNSVFRALGKVQKTRQHQFVSNTKEGGDGEFDAGADGSYTTLQDGMDQKLKSAAAYFKFETDETAKQDPAVGLGRSFFSPAMNNDFKDSGNRNQRVSRPRPRYEFKVTTAEALKKADFRNVTFLANFITEAGIIVKRSKTGISAKAQRKIAREIKTARAFGLLPFTTMGTKPFSFGQSMEDATDSGSRQR